MRGLIGLSLFSAAVLFVFSVAPAICQTPDCLNPPISRVQLDTTGKYLCYNNQLMQAVTYESFATTNLNSMHDSSTGVFKIADYFNTIEYVNNPNKSSWSERSPDANLREPQRRSGLFVSNAIQSRFRKL